ncbi:hypothetical protein BpHYR1_007439 [Brachionus plicatilis]|uniref:Uncharacterized protein n=1 Tax=Brachionus plicatilis TaxID=10195 RepID=A0A3M7R1K1_BRAPC|nr:hypothetical protein BpHYR1_007439 [Brachionus plicatilis]
MELNKLSKFIMHKNKNKFISSRTKYLALNKLLENDEFVNRPKKGPPKLAGKLHKKNVFCICWEQDYCWEYYFSTINF